METLPNDDADKILPGIEGIAGRDSPALRQEILRFIAL